MPVYVYRCESCGSEIEKRQSFFDAPLTTCEQCSGKLRKVLTPAAIIYKGSGFYSTDHNGKSGSNGRNGSSEKSNGTEKTDSKTESTTESKAPATTASSPED